MLCFMTFLAVLMASLMYWRSVTAPTSMAVCTAALASHGTALQLRLIASRHEHAIIGGLNWHARELAIIGCRPLPHCSAVISRMQATHPYSRCLTSLARNWKASLTYPIHDKGVQCGLPLLVWGATKANSQVTLHVLASAAALQAPHKAYEHAHRVTHHQSRRRHVRMCVEVSGSAHAMCSAHLLHSI